MRPKYLLLLISLFVFTFILSEVLYSIFHPAPQLHTLLLTFSKAESRRNIERSFNLIKLSSLLNSFQKSVKYKKEIDNYLFPSINTSLAEVDTKFSDSYSVILSKIIPEQIVVKPDYPISKIFYDLSIAAYQSGEQGLIEPLLLYSVSVQPELSYYHVELANYFLSQGQKEKSINEIDYCIQFVNPRQHCLDFKINNIEKEKAEPFGFMTEELNDYYQ